MSGEGRKPTFPSVDDCKPPDEGGPIARTGFSYQDEVAVSFLIEMLESPLIVKVHCETHDDVVVVRSTERVSKRVAEYIQIKASEQDKHWSIADLCERSRGRAETSLFEKSLLRDMYAETSQFRLVSLRSVNKDLVCLTYSPGAPGRDLASEGMRKLKLKLHGRFPAIQSKKGNGPDYWLSNCQWDVRSSCDSVINWNLVQLLRLSSREGQALLPDQADVLLQELRSMAKESGDAKWDEEREKKIITREYLREWWEARRQEMTEGAQIPSGGKLRRKMEDAELPDEVIGLAINMRRGYAARVRTPTYMAEGTMDSLVDRVKSELMTLRTQFLGGQLEVGNTGYHAVCVQRIDEICDVEHEYGSNDAAFMKGCMYDISDRCLHRFAGPNI